MKTMKLFSVISLVLFAFAATAAKPESLNGKSHLPNGTTVKHKVVVHTNPSLSLPTTNDFWIVLSDGNGRRIGAAKYDAGVAAYYFSEPGPVTGVRIARVIIVPRGGALSPFFCDPDVKFGTFRNGVTYQFNMYPKTSCPD
jgi:hypothetical protein